MTSVTGLSPLSTLSTIRHRRRAISSRSSLSCSHSGVVRARRRSVVGFLLLGIVVLLLQSNRLGLFVSKLHAQAAPLCRDAQLAVTETAHQIEGLARRLLVRETRRVRAHTLLH